MGRISNLKPTLTTLAPRIAPPPKIAESFYTSPQWRSLVAGIKRSRGNRCETCGQGGRVIGDHIVERRDGGADLDERNVRLLCIGCHNVKTAKARARRAGL